MTVELAAAIPVLIVVAAIAVNVLSFLVDCAAFDRIARDAVRVHAASPAYGQDAAQSCVLIEGEIRAAFSERDVDVVVSHTSTGADLDEYRATMSSAPTLFGMSLRSEVFGVALPRLTHEAAYVVDSYKPGVVI
ncbi:MAG TPA: hypothetical protein DCP91_07120 [Eggerthellaceae bacterium]|nr:hypothetical protein [Eggerthellaceae bacterium]